MSGLHKLKAACVVQAATWECRDNTLYCADVGIVTFEKSVDIYTREMLIQFLNSTQGKLVPFIPTRNKVWKYNHNGLLYTGGLVNDILLPYVSHQYQAGSYPFTFIGEALDQLGAVLNHLMGGS